MYASISESDGLNRGKVKSNNCVIISNWIYQWVESAVFKVSCGPKFTWLSSNPCCASCWCLSFSSSFEKELKKNHQFENKSVDKHPFNFCLFQYYSPSPKNQQWQCMTKDILVQIDYHDRITKIWCKFEPFILLNFAITQAKSRKINF